MFHFDRFICCPGTVFLLTFLQRHSVTDGCYDAWSIRTEPEQCNSSSDCHDPDADCIFSLLESRHVCCSPKPGAIFPKCPDGREILMLGKYTPVLCTERNSLEDDMCPLGYQCLPSTANFSKLPGQANTVCCK